MLAIMDHCTRRSVLRARLIPGYSRLPLGKMRETYYADYISATVFCLKWSGISYFR
jgi:hypothetical protein